MGGDLNFNVQGGNMGGISSVWWKEIIKPILQGPNVWDGKKKLVLSIKLKIKWQKHNTNTQRAEHELPLMFGLKNELEHLYKNQKLEI